MDVVCLLLDMPDSQLGRRQHASADVAPELFEAEEAEDDE
jgi:hypothetical protein